ncbi:putative non-specific serine/threonine protein kinase [Helianthus annuus]|nr:putative non-specific serine/threonine protein kinase [Helianthus annuus]
MKCCGELNWRTHLKFRDEPKLSPEAKKLICKLLCNVEKRLGTKGAHEIKVMCGLTLLLVVTEREINVSFWRLQAHPWFKGIEWEKLYQMEAAFIPDVNGELDTQSSLKRLIL